MSTHDQEFEQFFLDNYPAVLHILVLTTGDRERAKDATQEAFIKAYAKWSKVRRYDSPIAWVRRVAINASHDSFRKDRRRRRREEATPLTTEALQPDRYASDEAAAQLLMGLPDRQREVATLFYVDDRSVVTIADRPDAPRLRPVATVEAVIPAVSTTIVVSDPSGLADDASPVDPSSTNSSLPPATTELAEPTPPPPPPTEPRVVEPSSPPPVIAVPSSSVPAPEPAPAPEPDPTTTTSAAPSTTITSLCGQLVVTIESGRVFIASITALAGFDAIVGTDGPTSVEVEFKGEGGTCEIHAELEQGALDVEVQNPERDD